MKNPRPEFTQRLLNRQAGPPETIPLMGSASFHFKYWLVLGPAGAIPGKRVLGTRFGITIWPQPGSSNWSALLTKGQYPKQDLNQGQDPGETAAKDAAAVITASKLIFIFENTTRDQRSKIEESSSGICCGNQIKFTNYWRNTFHFRKSENSRAGWATQPTVVVLGANLTASSLGKELPAP